jgi:hypothetical protein
MKIYFLVGCYQSVLVGHEGESGFYGFKEIKCETIHLENDILNFQKLSLFVMSMEVKNIIWIKCEGLKKYMDYYYT